MTTIPDDPCDEWPKLLIEVRDLSNAAWTPMFSPSTMALFAHARESRERAAAEALNRASADLLYGTEGQ